MLHLKYTGTNNPTQQELEKLFNPLIGKEVEVITFSDEMFDMGALSFSLHKGKVTRIEAYFNDRNEFCDHRFHFDEGCEVEVHTMMNDQAPWVKATPQEVEENENLTRTIVDIGEMDYPCIISSSEVFIESCIREWDVVSILQTFGKYYPSFDHIKLSDEVICKALRTPSIMGDEKLTNILLNRAS